jgi:hypothetical protein
MLLVGIAALVLFLLFRSAIINKEPSVDTRVDDSKTTKEPPADVTVDDVKTSASGIMISLRNSRIEPAECVVGIEVGNSTLMRHVGLIGANDSKAISLPIEGLPLDNVTVVPHCVWQNMTIIGCINTSFELCQRASDKPTLRQCFSYEWQYQHFCAALLLNDARYCDDIETEPQLTHCLAYVGKEPALCEGLGTWRDWCYDDLATNWQREDLCRSIKSETSRNTCLAVLTNDEGYCAGLSENYTCLARIAELSGNVSFCDLTSDAARCRDELAWMK